MNTYQKFAPNVFLAKCTEEHQKGDVIPVTTRHGKENDSIIFNLIGKKEGFFFYSIVRADGYNLQERAKAKVERFSKWSESANAKSEEHYNRSKKDSDFLSLGEPIKVGHHSEKRHMKIIQKAQNNATKMVEFWDKAKAQAEKAAYWESRANEINLSIPESVEYYEHKLEEAKDRHSGLKSGKYEREHSFSLTYAKKALNEAEKRFEFATKLWA
jgi:hypothetical protein